MNHCPCRNLKLLSFEEFVCKNKLRYDTMCNRQWWMVMLLVKFEDRKSDWKFAKQRWGSFLTWRFGRCALGGLSRGRPFTCDYLSEFLLRQCSRTAILLCPLPSLVGSTQTSWLSTIKWGVCRKHETWHCILNETWYKHTNVHLQLKKQWSRTKRA